MAFWSSEKIKDKLLHGALIEPYDGNAIRYGAYELSLGPEAFLTSYEDSKKRTLADGEQLVIPPGQFGLLLTEEKVSIPNDVLGFISIKASIKFHGLVNVSGFHVDPGFRGKLKFAVYNAGSREVVLQRKQKVFLLWLSDLDQSTQPYSGEHACQSEITPEDVMRIAGKIASPGQLKKDMEALDAKFDKQIQTITHKLDNIKLVLGALLSVATGLAVFTLRGCFQPSDQDMRSKQVMKQSVQDTNAVNVQPRATNR